MKWSVDSWATKSLSVDSHELVAIPASPITFLVIIQPVAARDVWAALQKASGGRQSIAVAFPSDS